MDIKELFFQPIPEDRPKSSGKYIRFGNGLSIECDKVILDQYAVTIWQNIYVGDDQNTEGYISRDKYYYASGIIAIGVYDKAFSDPRVNDRRLERIIIYTSDVYNNANTLHKAIIRYSNNDLELETELL